MTHCYSSHAARRILTDAKDATQTLMEDLTKTNTDIAETDNDLIVLNNLIAELLEHANQQKMDVTEVIQEDIVGAYNTIVANDQL